VIVPVLVVLIQRRLPQTTSLVAVAVCAVGLYVLTSPAGGGFNRGDLLTIGCAALFALYIVLVQVYTETGAYDPRALAFAQFFGMLLVSLLALPIVEKPAVVWAWPMIWRGLVLGSMAALTLALQLYWQRFITATRAAIILTLEPPLAALFAFLLLGEVLSAPAYVGGGLIFLGMLVSEGGARLVPPSARGPTESA
jgi:drug/metabolite transporter (DMT)-like permease